MPVPAMQPTPTSHLFGSSPKQLASIDSPDKGLHQDFKLSYESKDFYKKIFNKMMQKTKMQQAQYDKKVQELKAYLKEKKNYNSQSDSSDEQKIKKTAVNFQHASDMLSSHLSTEIISQTLQTLNTNVFTSLNEGTDDMVDLSDIFGKLKHMKSKYSRDYLDKFMKVTVFWD